jgi:hypothetical protein
MRMSQIQTEWLRRTEPYAVREAQTRLTARTSSRFPFTNFSTASIVEHLEVNTCAVPTGKKCDADSVQILIASDQVHKVSRDSRVGWFGTRRMSARETEPINYNSLLRGNQWET